MPRSSEYTQSRRWSLARANHLEAHLGMTAVELAALIVFGIVATSCIAFFQTPIRMPGHAILKACLPLAIGLRFVPRPGAGTIMSSAAMLTAAVYLTAGVGHLQPAAMTALLAIGPAVDWAARRSQTFTISYLVRFALAGLIANMLAFAARWGLAFFQADGPLPVYMRDMLGFAFVSFAACGALAGLLCGVIRFRRVATDGPTP